MLCAVLVVSFELVYEFNDVIDAFAEPVEVSKAVNVAALNDFTTVLPSTNLIEPVEIYKSLQILLAEPKSNTFVV